MRILFGLLLLPALLPAQLIPLVAPPVLIHPVQGQVLPARTPLRLHWSVAGPAIGYIQASILEIVEVYPGQEPAQALRSNPPIIQRTILGVTQHYLSPLDLPVLPGDSLHLAWTVRPSPVNVPIGNTPNSAASEPEHFWLRDSRPPGYAWPEGKLPCGQVDAGPDQVIGSEGNKPVRIGMPGETIYRYEWTSDPPGYHAYDASVSVSPSQTTRYILTRTDTTTGCSTMDEVWVCVNGPWRLSYQQDACGYLHAVILKPGEPEPTGIAPPFTLMEAVNYPSPPVRRTAPPCPLPSYKWNTNATTSSILPRKPDAGKYRVTVTIGSDTQSITIPYEESKAIRGDFPTLVVPRRVGADDAFRVIPFRADEGPYCQATGYRLRIKGPWGYDWVHEFNDFDGLDENPIQWSPMEKDDKGIEAKPGLYEWHLSLINCEYPTHDPDRFYRVRSARFIALDFLPDRGNTRAARQRHQGHFKLQ